MKMEDAKRMIEHAPTTTVVANGAPVGYEIEDGQLCATCAGRIMDRGFGAWFRDATVVWDTDPNNPRNCGICTARI